MIVTESVRIKLRSKHSLSVEEVEEAISNLDPSHKLLEDSREQHKTNPPSLWFVSETNRGLKLKVVIIPANGDFYLKTAYPANSTEIEIYDRNKNSVY